MRAQAKIFGMILGMSILMAGTVTAERTHVVEPEDYFSIAGVGSVRPSPDGSLVAYTEMRWEPPREERNTDLWVVDAETGETRRLTFEKGNEGSPTWSPDGRTLYFSSSFERPGAEAPPYDGSRQVWRIPAEGGMPLAVTRVKEGIDGFELSADGKAVYYLLGSEKTDDEWKELRESHEGLQYGHGVTEFSEIWKLDLASWRAKKVVDERRVIGDFAVSRDQRRVAMVTTPDEEIIHNEGWSRIDVWDARDGKVRTVTPPGWRDAHPSPFGWLNEVTWSDDGDALAFSISFDGYPDRVYVTEWNGQEPETREIERPDGVNVVGGSLEWRPGGRDLAFIGEDRARTRLYSITAIRGGKQGDVAISTRGDVTVDSFGFSGDGAVTAVVTSTLTDPPDVYLVGEDGLRRLTKVNPQVDEWKLPLIWLVRWKGEGGREIEGVLELPPDYKKEDGPLPMVVAIHGGPTAMSKYRFRFWIYGRTLLPSRGYAVLLPNYRGSTGYGDDFVTELVGRENDIDVKDILAGVDAMVERGIADPERLGVMGWSNGGFLTNCIIARTDRFKAASSGAGVIDQVMQWGIEDTPGHVINFMEGNLPWSDPVEYRDGSPLYNLDKVRTPTLIHVGQNDPRVPAAHSRTLYRGLRYYLKVPTELLVYPGEGHGLTTYAHRKAKMEWDVAWFDRYILGKTEK